MDCYLTCPGSPMQCWSLLPPGSPGYLCYLLSRGSPCWLCFLIRTGSPCWVCYLTPYGYLFHCQHQVSSGFSITWASSPSHTIVHLPSLSQWQSLQFPGSSNFAISFLLYGSPFGGLLPPYSWVTYDSLVPILNGFTLGKLLPASSWFWFALAHLQWAYVMLIWVLQDSKGVGLWRFQAFGYTPGFPKVSQEQLNHKTEPMVVGMGRS